MLQQMHESAAIEVQTCSFEGEFSNDVKNNLEVLQRLHPDHKHQHEQGLAVISREMMMTCEGRPDIV